MLPYLSEFLGTALLILIGENVIANVNLRKSGHHGAGILQIAICWGFAVALPCIVFNNSGAHFNPAITVAFAVEGTFPWAMVPGYIVAQLCGGFVGAFIVYLLFKKHLEDEPNTDTKLTVFATKASIPNWPLNCLSEIVGTFILVFCIKGMGQLVGIPAGLDKLIVGGVIATIVMCMGGVTCACLNPARDWGPRLVYTLMPMGKKGDKEWKYGIIVAGLAPFVGAFAAIALNAVIPW